MNYKDLEIWQLARIVVIEIHELTLECLPNVLGRKLNNFIQSVEKQHISKKYFKMNIKYQESSIKHREIFLINL